MSKTISTPFTREMRDKGHRGILIAVAGVAISVISLLLLVMSEYTTLPQAAVIMRVIGIPGLLLGGIFKGYGYGLWTMSKRLANSK